MTSFLQKEITIGPIRFRDRVLFAEHLAVMLRAGLSIIEAFEIAEEASHGRMKRVLRDVRMSIQAGNTFANALARHPRVFSSLFISAVDAGERSGTLEKNLVHLAKQLDKEKKVNAKIRSAMVYPAVILLASFVLAIVMSYYILPQIIPLFRGLRVDLPLSTRAVLAFAETVEQHGAVLFVSLAAFVIVFLFLVRRTFVHPVTHAILLHLPLIRQVSEKSNLMRMTLTLGTLLKSGLHIEEAVTITAHATHNYYYRKALHLVADEVSKGRPLGELFRQKQDLFPKLVGSMVTVGEQSGSLDETLLYIASFYESEVDSATKTLTTAIEPLLLLFIGGLVGLLAMAIISPIYTVTGNIGR